MRITISNEVDVARNVAKATELAQSILARFKDGDGDASELRLWNREDASDLHLICVALDEYGKWRRGYAARKLSHDVSLSP